MCTYVHAHLYPSIFLSFFQVVGAVVVVAVAVVAVVAVVVATLVVVMPNPNNGIACLEVVAKKSMIILYLGTSTSSIFMGSRNGT